MSTKKNTNTKKTSPSPASSRSRRSARRETVVATPEQPETETDLRPAKRLTPDEVDGELALTFLTFYHALEQAMMRAGFTRAGRSPGSTQADWARFARHIENQFDPDSSPVLQGAVAYLLWDEANLARRNERMEGTDPWDNASPYSDIVWLSELLQRTWNRLTYDVNFPGSPAFDTAHISAALFIVEEWAGLDPEVGQFMHGRQQ